MRKSAFPSLVLDHDWRIENSIPASNGILGDKRPDGGNVLTSAVLRLLPKHSGVKMIFGETTRLSAEYLKRLNIVFKQIPYDVRAH